VFPAVSKEGTFIIQTYKIGLGAPAQAVANMHRRGTAAGKLLLAMGAVMFFIEVLLTST
jgi:hypothetical protein